MPDWLNKAVTVHLSPLAGADAAMQVLARYFPRSARDDAKQRFLLKHLSPSEEARSIDAPEYPGRGLPESPGG